ncbi:hypothetical protein GCM10018789_59980 [Streptomyces werraensis]|nr:hypothetical protein GCM10018789_59980 [Streptomyces werraensis]
MWREPDHLLPRAQAERTRAFPSSAGSSVEVVICGFNLGRISCPHCGAEFAPGWWGEAVSERYYEGFSTLMVTVPCCDVETSLNELAYDWPMGFARFRIEVTYPNRAWLTDEELASLTDALGHPLRPMLVHI